MDKKNLMIIGGVIAIGAIAYFMFVKKKDATVAAAPAGTTNTANAS